MVLELVLDTEPRPPRCPVMRGPRSAIQCEGPLDHDDDLHMARGKVGQWFFWTTCWRAQRHERAQDP